MASTPLKSVKLTPPIMAYCVQNQFIYQPVLAERVDYLKHCGPFRIAVKWRGKLLAK